MITNRRNPDQVTGNISSQSKWFRIHSKISTCSDFVDHLHRKFYIVFIRSIKNHFSKVSSMFSMTSFSTFSFLNVTTPDVFMENSNTLSPIEDNPWTFWIHRHHRRSIIPKPDLIDQTKYPELPFVFWIILFCLSFQFIFNVNGDVAFIGQINFFFATIILDWLTSNSKNFNQQIQVQSFFFTIGNFPISCSIIISFFKHILFYHSWYNNIFILFLKKKSNKKKDCSSL